MSQFSTVKRGMSRGVVADFVLGSKGNRLFQANAEVAFLRSYYDLALAREPPDGPFENGAFALHQLLKLRERKLAVGIESVPNGTRHLAYVFLDGKSHPYYYVISIEPRSRILRDVVSTLPEVWVADFA
jgi:hypothetical protein